MARKMKISETEKKEIIDAYNEYIAVYPKFQELQRIIRTQNPRALAMRYGVSYKSVRYLLGVLAPKIKLGDKDISLLEYGQRQVLELRNKGYTLEQVGKVLGVSRQRAHQIQVQAIKDLTRS